MRIGPLMWDVWWVVSRYPGLSKSGLAKWAALDGDVKRYAKAVDRAISAGIVHADGDPTAGYKLYAVPQSRWGVSK